MAGIISRRIKAAALLEVLVAITIMMTVVVIGTIIFVNVTGSSFTGEKIRAQLIIKKLSYETRNQKSYFDEEFNDDNILITKKVDPYKGNNNLLMIWFKAVNADHVVLAERKEIIIASNEEGKGL